LEPTEKELAFLLQQGNESAFEKVFITYFKALHGYAFTIVKEEAAAEELVQEVFFKIWRKRNQLNIQTSLKAYLYAAVYNESMDYIKERKKTMAHASQTVYRYKNALAEADASGKLGMNELEIQLRHALNNLPEQCRTIFQLSRFEGLKYRDIAAQLGLSVKTIEAQMGKALKRLRIALAEFLPVLILLLWK